MEQVLESAAAKILARGRPGHPVRNDDTGQTHADCTAACEWLATVGVGIQPQTLRNCVGEGRRAGGFMWSWAEGGGKKPGPMKGCGGRPRRGTTGPVNLVPRTPVVASNTGECWSDAEAAADYLSIEGHPVDAKGIVAAILSGQTYAERFWDWRGRSVHWCGVEAETGRKCPGCRERSVAVTVAVAAGAGVNVGA